MENRKALEEKDFETVNGGKKEFPAFPPCLYVPTCATCGFEKVFEKAEDAEKYIEENNFLCPQCGNRTIKIAMRRKR